MVLSWLLQDARPGQGAVPGLLRVSPRPTGADRPGGGAGDTGGRAEVRLTADRTAEKAAWEAGARLALSKAGATLALYADVLALNPYAVAERHACDVCGEPKPPSEFVPRPWAPLLHSKTCCACKEVEAADRAELLAARREERRRERCPTPDKKTHTSRAEAQDHITSLYRAGRGNPDYQAYPCACGSWHVGHSGQRLRQRIKGSLRGGRR